jgi:hypothetical protein
LQTLDSKYLSHYLDMRTAALFMVISFAGLVVILSLIFLYAYRYRRPDPEPDGRRGYRRRRFVISRRSCELVESFYELVFSSTSILFFLAAYYLIDRFLVNAFYRAIWDRYKDLLLMAFIFLSIFLNAFLDRCIVTLRTLGSGQKAAIRLVSTIYMILIFLYIRFIYDDLNYDELIIYFVGLVIGRFVYFDFTWKDFSATMKNVWRQLPLLGLILLYSALMCYVGFRSHYLWTSNGVIVSILIAHIFMDISIFIAHGFLKGMREDTGDEEEAILRGRTGRPEPRR